MHLVTIERDGEERLGVLVGEEILDLSASEPVLGRLGAPSSMRALLAAGDRALEAVRRAHDAASSDSVGGELRERGGLVAARDVHRLAPVPDPRIIVSAGGNFRAHVREMGVEVLPTEPSAFLKSPNTVIGPDSPIILPRLHPDMVDWEAEVAVVIGRTCHNVDAEDAFDHVAGFTMVNDVSARDWVEALDGLEGLEASRAWDKNILGKQFPTFCPMGPALATKDEIADWNAIRFTLFLNGVKMQEAVTDDLVFSVPEMIAYYSRFYRFLPGDIITLGSPSGVGLMQRPPLFLKEGDIVEVVGEGIGTLTNSVVAEKP